MDLEEYKKRMDAIRKTYVDIIQKLDDELAEKTRLLWAELEKTSDIDERAAIDNSYIIFKSKNDEKKSAAMNERYLAEDKLTDEVLSESLSDKKGFLA